MLQLILYFLYNLLSNVNLTVCLYIVARFVFGRMDRTDKLSLKRMLAVVVPTILIISALTVWNSAFSQLDIIIYIIMFVTLDSRRKVSDVFLYFSILGIIMGIYMLPLCLLNIIYGSMEVLIANNLNAAQVAEELLLFIIVLITCTVLYYLNKKYPLYFTADNYKKSTKFYTVTGFGYFILLIVQILIDEVYNNRMLIFIIFIILAIMDVSVLIMLVQEYRVKYFCQIAALNEYYLNSQVEQFKNYRFQQRETRRIRHDMQNHLIMLSQLAKAGDLQEIRNYIGSMSQEMQSTASELRTGNDTADAIVNAKYSQAAHLGIKVEINGMFPPEMNIAAIDMCTIFANALDNAIEGIPHDCAEKSKVITINITSSNSMHMVTFRNPTKLSVGSVLTSNKADKINHGFGFENMKRTAEKYNGQLNYRIEGEGEDCYFVLEAVIFC